MRCWYGARAGAEDCDSCEHLDECDLYEIYWLWLEGREEFFEGEEEE